ncbi:hypothetical protein C8F04DRAFT_1194118 [Mycena alexandri]|uniref:DUF6533 domain-containing protein n=1 Tax=Mycena alexandri TaxID=1745969 RepID=A0AAD6S9F4_9AGAR|nr:hypothetical protein C8F04DRAFT_1194118 [Mycena alexandri]
MVSITAALSHHRLAVSSLRPLRYWFLNFHERCPSMSATDIQGQLYVFKSTFAYRSPTASSRIVGAFDIWPFIYDHLLTLEWEISRYWGEAFTLTVPNVLFFANRYGTLFGNIPVIIPCHKLVSYHQYFIVATQLLVGIMLFLRTYALYERSKRALVLMLGVAVAAVAVGLWSVITDTSDDTSMILLFGCNFTTSRSEGNSLAVAWAGVTVYDSTIFLLTLYRVFGRHRANGLDLFTVLLRDDRQRMHLILKLIGTNLLNAIQPDSRGIATTFTNIGSHPGFIHPASISSIMIARLMLNLRDPVLTHMSGRLPQSVRTTGNDWFAGNTVAGGSPVLDTNLDIELPERRAVPSDSRTLRV